MTFLAALSSISLGPNLTCKRNLKGLWIKSSICGKYCKYSILILTSDILVLAILVVLFQSQVVAVYFEQCPIKFAVDCDYYLAIAYGRTILFLHANQ